MKENQIPCFSKYLVSSSSPYSPLIMVILQGRSSTKIVGGGGGKVSKNVGHHSWQKEKILGFEWAKTTQMALKFLQFFQNIFMFRILLVYQNNFCKSSSFNMGIFS